MPFGKGFLDVRPFDASTAHPSRCARLFLRVPFQVYSFPYLDSRYLYHMQIVQFGPTVSVARSIDRRSAHCPTRRGISKAAQKITKTRRWGLDDLAEKTYRIQTYRIR